MADSEGHLADSVPVGGGCDALAKMRDLAQKIVMGEGDPIMHAHDIHYFGTEEVSPDCPDGLHDLAWEFFELYEAAWISQDKAESKAAYGSLLRDAAEAFLEGRPFPVWQNRGGNVPWRPPGS